MCNLSTPVNTLLSLPLTQTCCWILELSPKFAHHQSSVSGKTICDPQLCSSTLSHKLKFTPKLIWRKQLMQTQAHTTSLQYIHKTSILSLCEDHCIILKSSILFKDRRKLSLHPSLMLVTLDSSSLGHTIITRRKFYMCVSECWVIDTNYRWFLTFIISEHCIF
jgi:hypothetical protein